MYYRVYYRVAAIGLTTAFHLVGAFHYRPLWIGVVVVPLVLCTVFKCEAGRARYEAIREMQEIVINMPEQQEE